MQLEDLTEQSHELLKAMLSSVEQPDENETSDDKFRHAFILYHAKNILQIAEDILDLEDRNRTASSPLLVRGMLENLFILGAAVRNKEFVGQKIIYDLEMTAHYARSTAKRSPLKELKEYLEDEASSCEADAKNLRQKHQINGKFKLSPADCAEKAEFLRQYAIEYAHYSAATHGEFFSLFLKEQIGTTAHAVRTVAFICLKSVEFLLISIKTNNSVDIGKRLIDLFREFKELERAGKFKELYQNEMKGEQPIARGKRGARLQQN